MMELKNRCIFLSCVELGNCCSHGIGSLEKRKLVPFRLDRVICHGEIDKILFGGGCRDYLLGNM